MTKVIASIRKKIMGYVNELDTHVKKVEISVAAVPEMVKLVMNNIDKSSASLEKVDSKVDSNFESIRTLKDSVMTLETRSGEAFLSCGINGDI